MSQKYKTVSEIIAEGYDNKHKIIPMRFTAKEYLALCQMMKDERWENFSGYIKEKLFGRNAEQKYKKVIGKPKSQEEIAMLTMEVFPFIRQELDYINFKYEKVLAKIEKDRKANNQEAKFVKSYEAMKGWKNELLESIKNFGDICKELLERLEYGATVKDYSDLESIPDSVLEAYMEERNWVDASEYAKEYDRRYEKEKKEKKTLARRELVGIQMSDMMNETLQGMNKILQRIEKIEEKLQRD